MYQNKQTKRNTFVWLIPAILVFAAGFISGAVFDFKLTQAMYTPGNYAAAIYEVYGWYPAFLPAFLLAVLIASKPSKSRLSKAELPVSLIVIAIGGLVMAYMSFHYMQKRNMAENMFDLPVILTLLAIYAVSVYGIFALRRIGHVLRKKLTFFAFMGSVYMLANQVIINLIKSIWQRTRFDDMFIADNFDRFTSWFRPFGNGGSSFPSGHTANAAGIFIVFVLCDLFASWYKKRWLVYVLCWGYVASMAFMRILIGRHYLSDTFAAAGIMALIIFFLRKSNFYQSRLQAVLK